MIAAENCSSLVEFRIRKGSCNFPAFLSLLHMYDSVTVEGTLDYSYSVLSKNCGCCHRTSNCQPKFDGSGSSGEAESRVLYGLSRWEHTISNIIFSAIKSYSRIRKTKERTTTTYRVVVLDGRCWFKLCWRSNS